MNELLKLGILELNEKIRAKKITPLEITQAYIKQIEQVNPKINAMVEDNFINALKDAKTKTEELHLDPTLAETKKLYGIPFTSKEMFAIEGFLQTAGNVHQCTYRAQFTATIVQRCLDEGGILLGTSNVPEMGFWFETNNAVYGRTSNPYNLKKTAGGSTGGEAALIGSGCSTFGLGSDVGGSVRIPAFFCGIFGHKPTNRTIPHTGHYPHTQESLPKVTPENYTLTTSGPLAKKSRDLNVLMKIFAQPDQWDKVVTKKDWLLEPRTSMKGLKVYICPNPMIRLARRADQELQEEVLKSAKYLEQLGAKIIDFDSNFFAQSLKLWSIALSGDESKSFEDAASAMQGMNLSSEFLNLIKGQPRHSFPALVTVLLERTMTKLSMKKGDYRQVVDEQRRKLNEILGDDGILILPPHSRVAPNHNHVIITPFDFVYGGVFNGLGNPATAIPTGINSEGLPLGVQVVARHFHDHLTLGVAQVLEDAFGGWVPPKLA